MRRPLLLALAPVLALTLASCGSPEGTLEPRGPVDPTIGLAKTDAGEQIANETVLLLQSEIVDALSVLQDLGLGAYIQDLESNVALIRDLPFDALQLELDPRIVAVQSNTGVVLGNPADLTMAFFEGEIAESDLLVRPEFDRLDLARVHRVARGAGIRVAVLDTGLDVEHPHFTGRVEVVEVTSLGSPAETADGIDDDGDGLVDEAFGHGSHVAGIIATVAPEATIVPFRTLDSDGVGTAYELALGLRAAIDAGVDVINLSISLGADSNVVSALIDHARSNGIAVVAAGGNTGDAVTYPAAYPTVIGTAATVADMTRLADFSARGIGAALAAPGTEILSAHPGGSWATASGSSMASAVVAGAIAIVTSSELTGDVLVAESRVLRSAVVIEPTGSVEHGRLNLLAALETGSRTPRGIQINQRH